MKVHAYDLRRFRRNLYNLRDFEAQFKDQREAQWAMRYPHQADVRADVSAPT